MIPKKQETSSRSSLGRLLAILSFLASLFLVLALTRAGVWYEPYSGFCLIANVAVFSLVTGIVSLILLSKFNLKVEALAFLGIAITVVASLMAYFLYRQYIGP